MYYYPLLLPLLLQVALTLIIAVVLFTQRVAEFQRKRINPQQVPTRTEFQARMTDTAQISDNFQNQFELPVLFYLAVTLALTLLLPDPLLAVLAWGFVIFRVLHAVVHITYNNVMHRFMMFAFSTVMLMTMWVRLAWLIYLH